MYQPQFQSSHIVENRSGRLSDIQAKERIDIAPRLFSTAKRPSHVNAEPRAVSVHGTGSYIPPRNNQWNLPNFGQAAQSQVLLEPIKTSVNLSASREPVYQPPQFEAAPRRSNVSARRESHSMLPPGSMPMEKTAAMHPGQHKAIFPETRGPDGLNTKLQINYGGSAGGQNMQQFGPRPNEDFHNASFYSNVQNPQLNQSTQSIYSTVSYNPRRNQPRYQEDTIQCKKGFLDNILPYFFLAPKHKTIDEPEEDSWFGFLSSPKKKREYRERDPRRNEESPNASPEPQFGQAPSTGMPDRRGRWGSKNSEFPKAEASDPFRPNINVGYRLENHQAVPGQSGFGHAVPSNYGASWQTDMRPVSRSNFDSRPESRQLNLSQSEFLGGPNGGVDFSINGAHGSSYLTSYQANYDSRHANQLGYSGAQNQGIPAQFQSESKLY